MLHCVFSFVNGKIVENDNFKKKVKLLNFNSIILYNTYIWIMTRYNLCTTSDSTLP